MRTGVVKDRAKEKNVVHFRLKKGGKRFEVSVLKDKLPTKEELKSKTAATDILWDLVLANRAVFSNAAKAEIAKKSDLDTAFENLTEDEIIVQILLKGEMLLNQEDRAEHTHESLGHLHAVSERIAAMIFARPTEEDLKNLAAKKSGKLRLLHYTAEEVERELKNVKFKPLCTELKDQAVEGIVAVANGVMLPTLRDQTLVTIVPSAEGQSVKDLAAQLATYKPGYLKVVEAKKNCVVAVVDPELPEQMAGVFKIESAEVQHIPKGPADDLTMELPARSAAPPAATAGKEAKKPAEKPSAKKTAKKDDDEEEVKGSKTHSLEAELAALKADSSDDDGKKKKKKPAKAPAPKQQPAKAPPKPAKHETREESEEEDDEDEAPTETMKPKKRR